MRYQSQLDLGVLRDVYFPLHYDFPLTHAFGDNEFERDIFRAWATNADFSLQDLFCAILAFRGSSLPKASWHGNTNGGANPSHVNADDTVCTSCALDLVEASLFEWWLSKRQSTTATVELSEDIMIREDCRYGIECRTARHNEQHARTYNHICQNTVANQLTEHDDLPENGNRYVTESTNLYANFPAFSPSAIMFRDKGKEPSFMCPSVRPTRSGIDIIPGKLTIWGPYLGVQVYYGERGREYLQSGQVQLLMDTKSMRWVQTSRGIVPEDCRPVVGGRRTDAGRSRLLFHCAVWWRGQRIPGYTFTDTEYATITWGGQEWYLRTTMRSCVGIDHDIHVTRAFGHWPRPCRCEHLDQMADFRNPSRLAANGSNAEELLRPLVTCGICMELYVDPVALLDCLHLACGSCAKEWLESSTCHQCRERVRSTRDSHHTAAIVEAFQSIAPNSGLVTARTSEEVANMRERYRPGRDTISRQRQESRSPSPERVVLRVRVPPTETGSHEPNMAPPLSGDVFSEGAGRTQMWALPDLPISEF
ncbi:zf-C3HC4 domain-containing protein [Rhizoctonia solani AG-1 IA]|uniref:Zf-C3HC4 domain-containing protein n=1 Tax=Thanatephorus cucumeris (strain AG1-IA) TaxID=983506 RepID=L8WW27_THACA|nr:zf-C3HC4 domain-containing protein [Rhizoctonia solani AG-1 IA]